MTGWEAGIAVLNRIEKLDANQAVLENIDVASVVARKIYYRIGRKESLDDLRQVGFLGMIEGSRLPMEDDAPDFRTWLLWCAWRAIVRYIRKNHRRERQCYVRVSSKKAMGGDESRQLVELTQSKCLTPDKSVLRNEWWDVVTIALDHDESEFANARFMEAKSIEDAAAYLGMPVFSARQLERSIRTKCGSAIRKIENIKEVIQDVPSYRVRDGVFRNGRPVVDESTGNIYPTVTALAREIGCDVAALTHAIRRKCGVFEGRTIRYAVGSEIELSRANAADRVVRIDPRSRGVICITTGIYYRSVLACAKSHGWPQPTFYKAMQKHGKFAGKLFRYATNEENERQQQRWSA